MCAARAICTAHTTCGYRGSQPEAEKKRKDDEIVVLYDQTNGNPEILDFLSTQNVELYEDSFSNDFAEWKNKLNSYCTGDYIFQIDADEMLYEIFIQNLPQILIDNPTIQLFCLPRINTVEGLTQEHIQKWGWNVNEKGWINFPDVQTRIIQNSQKIKWIGKVHEVIYGHTTHAILPIEDEYCILHHKNIKRQEIQNTLYSVI